MCSSRGHKHQSSCMALPCAQTAWGARFGMAKVRVHTSQPDTTTHCLSELVRRVRAHASRERTLNSLSVISGDVSNQLQCVASLALRRNGWQALSCLQRWERRGIPAPGQLNAEGGFGVRYSPHAGSCAVCVRTRRAL